MNQINPKKIEAYRESNKKFNTDLDFDILSGFGWKKRVEVPFHWHDYLEIVYVNKGNLTIINDKNQKSTIDANHFVLFCPREIHSTIMEEGFSTEILVIKIDISPLNHFIKYSQIFDLEQCHETLQKTFSVEEFKSINVKKLFYTILKEFKEKEYAFDLFVPLKISELLLLILRYWNEQGVIPHTNSTMGFTNNKLLTINDYIKENLHNNVSALECARECNLSYSHFSREYKRIYKISFKKHITNLRFEKAIRELLTTNNSISEISDNCGFTNSSYFINSFKQRYGVSPLQYKKRNLQG